MLVLQLIVGDCGWSIMNGCCHHLGVICIDDVSDSIFGIVDIVRGRKACCCLLQRALRNKLHCNALSAMLQQIAARLMACCFPWW